MFSPIAGLMISQTRYGVDEQGHTTTEADLVDPVTGTLTAMGGW